MSLFRFIRSQEIIVTVSLTLLVQLLNLSVDPADFTFEKEDLTKNEIESIVELVTEHFLGHKNLIDESDEGDQHSIHCEMHVLLFSGSQSIELSNTPIASIKPLPTEFQFFFELIPKTILTPPPQV